MTPQVMDTVKLKSWIMGWGEKLEVLEPEEIREEVLQTATAMVKVYRGR